MPTLARNGKTRYCIVTPSRPSPPVAHAAAELARVLAEITGAKFPLMGEREYRKPLSRGEGGREGPAIFVGLSRAAREAAPDASLRGLGKEGLVIKTVGPHLLLYGGEPRGTLYAVYTFLEEHLGCRWWTSEASHIPKRPTLRLGEIAERQVPVLEYREPFFWDAYDADWAVRNKSNGHATRLDGARGGKIVYQGFVHTFYPLVPPEEHFAAHPEWYSEINGKRVHDHAQLCLTNPELLRFLTGRVLDWLREHPEAGIVSVSQNDWHGYCECARCREVDEREGSHAGSLLHFVNAVADEVAKHYPGMAVDTLAYQYTRKPPRFVRPRPNVIVRLCSIECNFAQPLTHPSNKAFYDDLVGWGKVCRRLYVWDYVTNFHHYLRPHANIHVLAPNVRAFVVNGVRGVFEQGSYQSPGGEMAPLKAWVLAKLLWNPERNERALVREFLRGYYGAARPHIGRYLEIMHRDALATNQYLDCFAPVRSNWPSYRALVRSEQAFARAAAAVAGDPGLSRRVALARTALTYTWVWREDLQAQAAAEGVQWGPGNDPARATEEMVAIWREHGVTHYAEGAPLEQFAQTMLGFTRRQPDPPPGFAGVPGVVDYQDLYCNLTRNAWRVADPTASDGVCAAVPGDPTQAGAIWVDLLLPGGRRRARRYRAFAVIKCGMAPRPRGDAFSLGWHEYNPDRDRDAHTIPASQVTPGAWQVWEIGTVNLTGHARAPHLWLRMTGTPGTVRSAAVDRFFLVPE